MSDIDIVKLKNGLRIATDEFKSVETVSIGVFVETGSRNEEISNNGISHFLEHMAFKGTKKRTAKKIAEEFENIGGRINAYTSKERTVYYAKVLKNDAEFAMEFLSDIIQNSTFTKSELEKERGVILQEIAMTNDTPDDIIFDYFQETAFPNQSLGRSILGPSKNIKSFKRSDFTNYIDKQYNFSNIAITAAGNINSDNLTNWSKKYFNNLNSNKIDNCSEPVYKGGSYFKQKDLEQVNLVFGFNGVSYLDKDYYTAQIAAMILGGGMSSRLFQEVRENLGLAYSIYSFNSSYKDCGLFSIYAATSNDKVEKLIDASKKEIEKISKSIKDEELLRAKTQFKAGILMQKESTSSRMQKLGNEILSRNKILTDKEIIKKLELIQKKDVIEVINKIISSKTTFAAIGNIEKIQNNVSF